MNRLSRIIVLSCIVFISLSSAFSQVNPNSKSVSIQIVAVVPPLLQLSLDFAQNSSTQLAGYIGGIEESRQAAHLSSSMASGFEIKEGVRVELGDARLFSNITGSYSIDVYSVNGGTLRDPRGIAQDAIPYSLSLGENEAIAKNGTFNFRQTGKSTRDGSTMKVSLAITDVPPQATRGLYVDNLMFSVSAN
jgi:hypothetical protein